MKKQVKKTLLLLCTSFITVWIIVALLPRIHNYEGKNPLIIAPQTRPLLIAHGGGNREFPDNTLEAFYHAYSIDPTCMMETDVSLTKDGVIILSHDTTLDRKTNLTGAIIDYNYQDLLNDESDFAYENKNGELIKYRNYLGNNVLPTDVNYPDGISPRHDSKFLVTTLKELIISFPNNYINVEIKQKGEIGLEALATVFKLMDELDSTYHTYERIVLASFHQEIYEKLVSTKKYVNSKLKFSPATKGVTAFFLLQLLGLDLFYLEKITVFQLPIEQYGINLASKNFIAKAHRHNIALHYWTIDDEETITMLVENGADGIMTNIPSLLKDVYDRIFIN